MNTFSNNKAQRDDFLQKRKSLSEDEQLVEARQIVSEIDRVDVDAAAGRFMQGLRGADRRTLVWAYLGKVAAVLLLPLLAVLVYVLIKMPQPNPQLVAMQEVSSPKAMRTKLNLSDGTTVWLNAESTLRFPVAFTGKTRKVELTGEAYFEVAKDTRRHFIVSSDKVNVKVLGTAFNFRSYARDKEVEVVLKEGSVLMESSYNTSRREELLSPGSRVVVDKESGQTVHNKERVDKYTAWHQGKLVLDDASIQEVATKLERWYGVKVKVNKEGLSTYRFNTTFENEPLEHVLGLLELSSPISIEYHKASYNKQQNSFTKPGVVITKK